MRLQRLTGLERDKILEEHKETVELIAKLRAILANEKEIYSIIVEELKEIKEKYGDERRTQIVAQSEEISIEDLIVDEDMAVTISHEGYIKRNPVTLYRAQRRGGKGKIGATTKEEDFVEYLFIASMHSYILFFTTIGKVYWIKVHELPQASRAARGKPIVNLLHLEPGEKVSAFLTVREFQEGRYMVFATKKGLIKKTELMSYANPRSNGIRAIALEDEDEVIGVRLTDGQQEIILSTADGQSIRFKEEQVRPTGRGTYGVVGMRLDDGDSVVSMEILSLGFDLLTVAENGFGKRTEIDEYRLQSRGGKGIITMKTTDKTGRVVGVQQVTEDDQLMLVTNTGKIIRLRIKDIRVIGRNTQGVRLIDLEEGERVVSLARLAEKEEEDEDERPRTVAIRSRCRRFLARAGFLREALSQILVFPSISSQIMLKPIGVIGAGGWGIALAKLLADKGEPVTLWCHGAESFRELSEQQRKSNLSSRVSSCPSSIEITRSLEAAVADKS